MRRGIAPCTVCTLILTLAACDTGTQPGLEPGNVDAYVGATVARTDSGVAVDGTWRLRHPASDRSLWLERNVAYDFGGFPEIAYPQVLGPPPRAAEARALMLTHRKAQVQRNDSTILSYVDHGDATVEDDSIPRLTVPPTVPSGTPVGYDDFVRYYETAYSSVVWTGGASEVLVHAPWYDALAAGSTLTLRTTGSADASPVSARFSATPMARLTAVQNGGNVPLDVDTPPSVSTRYSLVLDFDRPLVAEHTFLVLVPVSIGQTGSVARQAFLQPRTDTDRIVIPHSVLWQLTSLSSTIGVPYVLTIREIRWQDDVFAGTLAGGATFSLPFVQASETTLLLYLEP